MIALVITGVAFVVVLLTWLVGWWALLIVGLIAGLARRRPAHAALAAALGWAALLAFDARTGRLGALATVLGGVFPIPGWALVIVTLLFAALGAWSTATVALFLTAKGHSVEG